MRRHARDASDQREPDGLERGALELRGHDEMHATDGDGNDRCADGSGEDARRNAPIEHGLCEALDPLVPE